MTNESPTALVLRVPETELLVGPFRARLDPAAADGMPAHVTILWPFKPLGLLGDADLAALAQVCAGHAPLTIEFAEARRFPGVLYLAPEPAAPIRALVAAVVARFPEYPPYGGAFAEVVPHLTVAMVEDGQALEPIEAEFAQAAAGWLPIRTVVTEVTLFENTTGRWQPAATFALGRREAGGMTPPTPAHDAGAWDPPAGGGEGGHSHRGDPGGD